MKTESFEVSGLVQCTQCEWNYDAYHRSNTTVLHEIKYHVQETRHKVNREIGIAKNYLPSK